MSWLRWLIVALCVVLVLGLFAYARGERQRGETEPASSAATLYLV